MTRLTIISVITGIVTVFTVGAREAGLAGTEVAAHQLDAVAAILTRVGRAGERRGPACWGGSTPAKHRPGLPRVRVTRVTRVMVTRLLG